MIAAILAAVAATAFIGPARDAPPPDTMERVEQRYAMSIDVPAVLGAQVAAQLGYSLDIPRHMAMLSPSEVIEIVRSIPAHIALEAVHVIPGVGPAWVSSFPVNCADSEAYADALVVASTGAITTPAVGKIRDPFGASTISYTCQNTSTTLVQVGDSKTIDPDTTRRGPVYCATNCPSQEWGGNAYLEYCRGATDTTIYCRALVTSPGPR